MNKMKLRGLMWMTMLILSIIFGYFVNQYFAWSSIDLIYRILGIFILMLSGLTLRKSGKALKQLGKPKDNKFGETTELVTTGIYECIRHPHHTGIGLFLIGFALLLGWKAYVFIFLPFQLLMLFSFVKFVEEPEAVKKFGDTYIEYSKRVPRFIPRLRCLRKNKGK